MNNELIIFGIMVLKLCYKFIFTFSLIILIFQILLLTTIVPKSEKLLRKIKKFGYDYFVALIKPKNLMIHLKV